MLRLVAHGESGYVAEPDARAIAAGIDHLAAHRAGSAAMAAAGLARVSALGIGWPRVMDCLLS